MPTASPAPSNRRSDPAASRRATQRIACGIDVIAGFETGAELRCRTVDISMAGSRLLFRRGMQGQAPAAMDRLTIPGVGTFDVTVRWVNAPELGVRFNGSSDQFRLLGELLAHLEKLRRDRLGG